MLCFGVLQWELPLDHRNVSRKVYHQLAITKMNQRKKIQPKKKCWMKTNNRRRHLNRNLNLHLHLRQLHRRPLCRILRQTRLMTRRQPHRHLENANERIYLEFFTNFHLNDVVNFLFDLIVLK